MIRVVLDTNTIVSAQLKPNGLEATVLLLALRGDISLFVSPPILAEYQRVLYKPKLRFDPRKVEAVLRDIEHTPPRRCRMCGKTLRDEEYHRC